MRACAAHGFAPRVVQEATNLQAVVSLVASGLAVGFVSASVADGMRREGVVFRPLSPPILELTNALAWREGHTNPAIVNLASALDALVDEVSSRPA